MSSTEDSRVVAEAALTTLLEAVQDERFKAGLDAGFNDGYKAGFEAAIRQIIDSTRAAMPSLFEAQASSAKSVHPLRDDNLLSNTDLPTKLIMRLGRNRITTLGELVGWSATQLLAIEHIGPNSIFEIRHMLEKRGLKLLND